MSTPPFPPPPPPGSTEQTAYLRGCARQTSQNYRDKWRAARVLIDGRWTSPLPASYHGRGYTYDYYACRCRPCTEARREERREQAARRRRRLGVDQVVDS